MIAGLRFLVTGGAGTIGSTIVDQLAAAGAREIVVLDNGRVVQRGRHDDLVDAPGLYATLYRAQQVARRWDVATSQRAEEDRLPQAVE